MQTIDGLIEVFIDTQITKPAFHSERDLAKKAIAAGIAHATKWIDVKEGLPVMPDYDIFSEQVLLKDAVGRLALGHYDFETSSWFILSSRIIPVLWRPIEFK
jgi:hypothetical protein